MFSTCTCVPLLRRRIRPSVRPSVCLDHGSRPAADALVVFQVPVHATLKELLILRAELQRRVEELQREASARSPSFSSEHSPSPTHSAGTPLHTPV